MSKKPFHAKSHAAMKAGAKRVPKIVRRVDPVVPTPHNAPLRAMKSSDYSNDVSLYEQLDELTPSAPGFRENVRNAIEETAKGVLPEETTMVVSSLRIVPANSFR